MWPRNSTGFNATLIIFLYCIVFYCIDVASKLYGVDATLIIFVFLLYCKQKLDEVKEDERRSRRGRCGTKEREASQSHETRLLKTLVFELAFFHGCSF